MRPDAAAEGRRRPVQGPRVSVVMPARDAAAFLPAAIAQIQAQTFADYEVLVVDDASTDGTRAALHDWAGHDPRVHVIASDERRGVAASRNDAVQRARGDLVWFTDVDDRWSPELLERLVGALDAAGADVAVGRAARVRVDDDRAVPIAHPGEALLPDGTAALRSLLAGALQGHLWNKLFRRDLLLATPFPGTRAFSDLGAMGHLLARARSVAVVDETLYTYVIRPGSILNSRESRARDLLDVRDLVRAAVAELPDPAAVADDLRRFEYAMVYVAALNDSIRRGRPDAAAKAVRREIRDAMTAGELLALARQGSWRLAAAAGAVRYAFPAYAAAYRLFRRLKWGSVGYW